MKQLGNLSIVCAQRTDVLMQIYGGQVSVHVGEGPERTSLFAAWDDDEVIQRIIHELNFGRYAIKEMPGLSLAQRSTESSTNGWTLRFFKWSRNTIRHLSGAH